MKNERTVAVVGAGYWGKNLVRNFDAIGVLAAICDRRPNGKRKASLIRVTETDRPFVLPSAK